MSRRWLLVLAGLVVLVVVATALGSGNQAGPTPTGRGSDASSTAPSPTAGTTSSLAANAGPSDVATPQLTSPAVNPASPPPPGTLEPLATLLAMLQVAPENRTGYERSLFVHWIDADGDGCDTRHEVLIRDAVSTPLVGPRCLLTGGRWVSLYDGLVFTDPATLQIDHVIPLAEAWDSGASSWSPAEREAFANDLGVPFALLAVSASTNESKSDQDPADWLPPAPAAECPYLGDWLATKVRWALAIDPRELDALGADLAACPSTTMPFEPSGWPTEPGPSASSNVPGPTPSATGASSGRGACDPAYPTVCIPPPPPDLDCADVPYRNFEVLPPDPHHFDGDHDGVGCET